MGSMTVWNSVLNVRALVGSFNQEKALVAVFSVIVKFSQTFAWPSFQALLQLQKPVNTTLDEWIVETYHDS